MALTRQLAVQDGETHADTASTLTHASLLLSSSCRAVVRAQCTAAMLEAPWQHQPRQQDQLEAAGGSSREARSADGVRDDDGFRASGFLQRNLIF